MVKLTEREGVKIERLDAKTLYKQRFVSSVDHAINSLLKIRDSFHYTLFPPDECLFPKEKNFRHCPFRYGFLLSVITGCIKSIRD